MFCDSEYYSLLCIRNQSTTTDERGKEMVEKRLRLIDVALWHDVTI